MYRVFISHSTEDTDIVKVMNNQFKLIGIEVFVAELSPEPGKLLSEKIMENIRATDCFVVLLTSSGIKSVWVQQEIGIARSLRKLVIPIVEKGVKVVGLLEGIEYITLDRNNINAAIEGLVSFVRRAELEKTATFSTGEAAKTLGLSFPTVKRWIYSGKIEAAKASSGKYRISKTEIDRLKLALKEKDKLEQVAEDVLELVDSKEVVFLRELQVCLEDKYTHKDIYDVATKLVPGSLQSVFKYGNRWYFPHDLKWQSVRAIAREKSDLAKFYANHPCRYEHHNVMYLDYSEFLVESAMLQAGWVVVAKDAYYFNGISYRTGFSSGRPKDLDFIAYSPRKQTYIGVQVKNRLEYPKQVDVSELCDICNVLHLRPILVARKVHPMTFGAIRNMGGEVIDFKRYLKQPPFDREKFQAIVAMGIPLGVYQWTPAYLVARFSALLDKL